MLARAPARPAPPSARPGTARAAPTLPRSDFQLAGAISLPSFRVPSIPRSSVFPAISSRAFATNAKPAPKVPAEMKKPAVDPRAFPDISPITGNKKPEGMWREVWFAGEETTWISPPIPVTKHLKRNPYQWARLKEEKKIKARNASKTKKPGKIMLSNHSVQLITTGKPLNDRRKLTFRIPIKMSKITLRQYLSKLYSLDVAKVNTMNVEGKWKRRMDGDGRYKVFKEPNWKKAYVTMRTELPSSAPAPEAKPAEATA